jgi:hypothetical protein
MIVVECPLNSLSFGNVSYNILRELYRKKQDIILFPIGEQLDLTAYKVDPAFQGWLQQAIESKWKHWDKDMPCLKLWHLMGSENRKTRNQHLYTFYECSDPTLVELAIARNQDRVIFSSQYSADKFKTSGVEADFIPLGFDEDFHTIKAPKPEGVHFGLMGKFEHRKRTEKIVQLWLKRYGNKRGFTLNLCINNPFMQPQEMTDQMHRIFGGKPYNNVNILPHLKTNEEVNMFLNLVDIDLGGLSGAEGWNLPSFNMTCLGKWSIVLNATAHMDWANGMNSILVEPTTTIPAYDGKFFQEGHAFNQGYFFDWDEKTFYDACDIAETKCRGINKEGLKLSQQFTYGKMVDRLLTGLEAD